MFIDRFVHLAVLSRTGVFLSEEVQWGIVPICKMAVAMGLFRVCYFCTFNDQIFSSNFTKIDA